MAGAAASPAPLPVQVRRLHPDAPLPSYAVEGDAGADLCTMVDVRLKPGERALLPTGLAIALPAGYVGFVQPRSGLAWRAGLGMVNAPGTIDSGYRGEIKVIVVNHDRDNAVELRRGDRIAQLVIQRVEQARFDLVELLPESARGAAGHGSTGGAGALQVGDSAANSSAANSSAANNRGDDQ
ncbi:MAG: dUTP diphosphatase [Jatrophihabitantaceae bacterium]